jgi:hypothetical protein
MKKIINGKLYNTDTADEIARRVIRHGLEHETYYRKKTGEIFIYYETKRSSGDIFRSIRPLELEEAKDDLEKLLTVEHYEEIFGKVEE